MFSLTDDQWTCASPLTKTPSATFPGPARCLASRAKGLGARSIAARAAPDPSSGERTADFRENYKVEEQIGYK